MDLFLGDLDSFSESSSYEYQDTEFFYCGKANSILSSLEESIEKIDDFLSIERGFRHGDIVCSITDPSGQMGRVISIDMIVDLENVLGNKIKEVDSKKLRKIRSLSTGDYVVNGPWLGKIEKIVDCVTVLFDDGSRCEFTTVGPEKLVPVSPDLLEDSQYPYYPGQRVKVELSSVSKSARWLCGRQKVIRDEGTVCAVDAGLVHVDWLGSALIGCEKLSAPPLLQDSKNLTLLSCFSHTNWQLGDWCIFPNLEEDDRTDQIFFKGRQQSAKEFERSGGPSFRELFVIARTKTKVDVLWQDGSQSVGLDSNMLFPVSITDAHDFWPEQFVLEKGTCDDPHVPCIQKWGVVRSVDAKERTVRVKWVSFVNQETDLLGEKMEETVSAYELVEHPDFSYCVGDVVFKFEKGKFVGHNEYCTESFLSRIGIVLGFKDGDVEVKWASGLTTKVAPHEIFQVDKCEDLFATPVRHENAEESNEEMTQHDKQPLGKERMGFLDCNGDGKDCQKTSWDSASFFIPKAAIGFFSSITASLFGSVGSTSESATSDHTSEDGQRSGTLHKEEVMELCNLYSIGPPLVVADLQTFSGTNPEQKVKEMHNSTNELVVLSRSSQTELFRQFDMVNGCSDHHFVDGVYKNLTSSQAKGGWLKKVQREWTILEKDLPETIYVRVYEERMDLLRAAIIGAPGTPYHDGLFIFDISLPPEYPHKPPLVHYNSGGLRVNPNLYESGKVCLSLLNTWTGTGSEVWNPGSSTILQVLLSLQALVLNEKPYFNEAGYDEQMGRAEGEKNSVSYNENAFLLSCKSMLYLLRKPPKHFEGLVEEHFRRRCRYILMSCREYMEGVPVGCGFGERKNDDDEEKGRSSSSTGFKIMLAKLFPKLVEAFSDKGIDCSHFVEL